MLGDRLLTTRRAEAADLGYSEPVVLGHLVRAAPVTGTLEPPPCDVPWAHRFGLSAARDRPESGPNRPGAKSPGAPIGPAGCAVSRATGSPEKGSPMRRSISP